MSINREIKICICCQHAIEGFIVDDADGEVYCHECHDELLYDRENME